MTEYESISTERLCSYIVVQRCHVVHESLCERLLVQEFCQDTTKNGSPHQGRLILAIRPIKPRITAATDIKNGQEDFGTYLLFLKCTEYNPSQINFKFFGPLYDPSAKALASSQPESSGY